MSQSKCIFFFKVDLLVFRLAHELLNFPGSLMLTTLGICSPVGKKKNDCGLVLKAFTTHNKSFRIDNSLEPCGQIIFKPMTWT